MMMKGCRFYETSVIIAECMFLKMDTVTFSVLWIFKFEDDSEIPDDVAIMYI
jgi:hypothetical protein